MKTFDTHRHSSAHYRFAQLKIDGFFIQVNRNLLGALQCVTKGYNNVDLSFLKGFYQFENLGKYETLQCELWKPGQPASYVSTGIATKDADMRLDVHGVKSVVGTREHETYFNKCLEAQSEFCAELDLPFVGFFDRENCSSSMGKWHSVDTFDEEWIKAQGVEGVVLKGGGNEPLKVKPFTTCDLVVVDVKPGNEGKYFGMIGSLTCATADGIVVANVSGMTDEERAALSVAHDNGRLLGTIVEVKYQKVGAKGKLRHPSFVRIRTDKFVADTVLA
jgi:hypothetical protein